MKNLSCTNKQHHSHYGTSTTPRDAFHMETGYTITLPRHNSGKMPKLRCECVPRIVQSAWFLKPGEGL